MFQCTDKFFQRTFDALASNRQSWSLKNKHHTIVNPNTLITHEVIGEIVKQVLVLEKERLMRLVKS